MTEILNQKTYGIFSTHESEKVISRLTEQNQQFIEFPPAQIIAAPVADGKLLKVIHQFDWIVFFEPIGVELFLSALSVNEIDFFELDNLRICTLGELTADKLRFEQIHTDIIFNLNQLKISDLIEAYVADERKFAGQKILIVKESGIYAEIEQEFTERNLTFETLEIFESKIDADLNPSKLRALLMGGAIDEMVVTSANDLISLRHYLVTDKNKFEWQISAVGENLYQFVRDYGYKGKIFKEEAV